MATQNVVNLNQSYFPMYLTETLHFNKVYHYLKYISLTFSSLNVRVFLCPASEQVVFFLYLALPSLIGKVKEDRVKF